MVLRRCLFPFILINNIVGWEIALHVILDLLTHPPVFIFSHQYQEFISLGQVKLIVTLSLVVVQDNNSVLHLFGTLVLELWLL